MAHEPIVLWTFIAVVLGGIAVMALITKFRLWGTLWRDWICSIDHKKIGIMYMILGLVMLLRGFADAVMMRLQQAMAFGDNMGYLPPHHYDQIFTAHGVIMIFFVAMPLVTGLMNYLVPLQIGARDVSFPFLNNFSFWMTTAGAVLVMVSLFLGEFSTSGWLALSNLGSAKRQHRAGLLHLGAADCRGGHHAFGHQPDRHHHQDARTRHEPDEDARLHLDCPVHQRADRGLLPRADGRCWC